MRQIRRVDSEEDPVKVVIFNKPYIDIRAMAVDDKQCGQQSASSELR